MKRLCLLILCLAACRGDETLFSYGAANHVWTLEKLNGQPYEATATLTFPEPGILNGSAPCNGYSGQQTAPYPWFEARALAVTKRACPQLDAETRFLEALTAMTLSEVSGGILVLSNDAGDEMVFTTDLPDG